MKKRKRGGFILVSSVAGELAIANMAMYSSTKAFLNVFAEALWNELAKDNIDVIAPVVGQTATPSLTDFLNPEARVKFLESTPQNVVRETMWGLGRTVHVWTGWSTKVQGFLYWLLPHEVLVPTLAYLSQDLFITGEELQKRFEEVGRMGRQSRN